MILPVVMHLREKGKKIQICFFFSYNIINCLSTVSQIHRLAAIIILWFPPENTSGNTDVTFTDVFFYSAVKFSHIYRKRQLREK